MSQSPISDQALALLGGVETVAQEAIQAENDLGTGGFPVPSRGTCILDSLEVSVAQARKGQKDGKEVVLAPECPLVIVHLIGKTPDEVEGKKDSIRQYLRATANQTLAQATARTLNVCENFGYPRERRVKFTDLRSTLTDIAKWIKEEDRVVDFNKVRNAQGYTNLYLSTQVVTTEKPQTSKELSYKGVRVEVIDEIEEGDITKCTVKYLEGSQEGKSTIVAKEALTVS